MKPRFINPMIIKNAEGDPCAQQEYLADEGFIYVEYLDHITAKEYAQLKNQQLQWIKQHQVKLLLENALMIKGNINAVRGNVFKAFDPEASRLGLERNAFVMNVNAIIRFSFNFIINLGFGKRKFEIKIFENHGEAIDWLHD